MSKEKLKKYENGFLRQDKVDKIDYTLIPLNVLTALAIHYTNGAKVHGKDNWMKCKDMNSFKESAFRHLVAVLENKTDEDHESALVWNINCLKWHRLND